MSVPPEIWFGLGAVLLGAAALWGLIGYRTRNKARDPLTESATREQYRQEEEEERRDPPPR